MYAFVPGVLFLVAFALSVRNDRRRFSNAVLLGLTFLSLSLGLLFQVAHLPYWMAVFILLLVLLLPVLGVVWLGVFLIANGVTMVRKEGRRPANLLSMLAGLAIFALLGLLVAVQQSGSPLLDGTVAALTLVSAYVSFVFLCFLGYAFLYGRTAVRGDVDFVVVLGSGLIGGERVPPLLASRLENGRQVYVAQTARGGRPPVLLASGGRGPDEKVAEARAMADWLLERGVPAEHVRLEDRSRTTTENLAFSRDIMAAADPGYRCVVVTNNFHAFRAAMTARKAGVNGQVLGSPTARYFWPSATIREFVAVFWEHRKVNLAICGFLVALCAAATLVAL
ncbi:YdcF family protein [Streptomyces sp. WAC06614]|uniref:YdcF family protein n=1 Tax=Streptomyces sp. WAC06614 TaxID=2487416 RepID=UPI000F76C062|nr:YdcF family protein [Streptomyces sp. WAC06614]RSS80952.1 YdcF family protein [Streptomyces sp. WAC06614]